MKVDIISQSEPGAQASRNAGASRSFVRIAATSEEMIEPRQFIRHAVQTIRVGKAVGQKPEKTALKCIGLMRAATTIASSGRRWSADPSYDPLEDMLELDAMAKAKIGNTKGLPPTSPVTAFYAGICDTIRLLSEQRR